MPGRRTGVLAALLVTAALFLSMPTLWRDALSRRADRIHPSLRPPLTRTLSVWLIPGQTGDSAFFSRLSSAFEKTHRGVRIFLRTVTSGELEVETAVRPDVLLFTTGDLSAPERYLLPLSVEETESSGCSGGVRYALPLWFRPMGVCYPESWGEDPWPALLAPGSIALPEGTKLTQLLFSCPSSMRESFVSACNSTPAPTVSPAPGHNLPPRRGPTPTPAPRGRARVGTGPAEGERFLLLSPPVSDAVRYAALCRQSSEAEAFLQYLLSADCASEGFISVPAAAAVLPNAFSHTREELISLCYNAFERCEDPALTLLRLR